MAVRILFSLLLFALTVLSQPVTSNPDFSGTGKILVLQSLDINNPPSSTVGCLNSQGRFVTSSSACGVFTIVNGEPTSSYGICGFPVMYPSRTPLTCGAQPNVSLYSLTMGTNYTFIYHHAMWVWYEAQSIPGPGVALPVYPIYPPATAGHVGLLLVWDKISG